MILVLHPGQKVGGPFHYADIWINLYAATFRTSEPFYFSPEDFASTFDCTLRIEKVGSLLYLQNEQNLYFFLHEIVPFLFNSPRWQTFSPIRKEDR